MKNYILKLKPALKDYIWGGDQMKQRFNMQSPLEKIAESWVLSCHGDGECVIANGEASGKTLTEVISREALGTAASAFEFFPILIKFIDARDNLSVQVHPSDEYALSVEHEYGKTEMWIVIDCDEGAFLYCGFGRDVTKDEVAAAINDGTLTSLLRKVYVKSGDVLFIEAGTIHAIGSGILIAEIQQNSNTTYRVFDFGRVDKNGKGRELHIEKALDVLQFSGAEADVRAWDSSVKNHEQTLARCKYFSVSGLAVSGEISIRGKDESFTAVTVTSGSGLIKWDGQSLDFSAGDCFFIPADIKEYTVSGKAELLLSFVEGDVQA